jgi:hypothetical protein
MANFNLPRWLMKANCTCLRLVARKSINLCRPFQLFAETVFVLILDFQPHLAPLGYLVTHGRNLACELKYFVMFSSNYFIQDFYSSRNPTLS